MDWLMVDPKLAHQLLPPDTWDWLCLDGDPYHGQSLTIVWDRTGDHYKRGPGLAILVSGREIARTAEVGRLTGKLPPIADQ
jgi:hypothetical protein